jgi:hypothetical protein
MTNSRQPFQRRGKILSHVYDSKLGGMLGQNTDLGAKSEQ